MAGLTAQRVIAMELLHWLDEDEAKEAALDVIRRLRYVGKDYADGGRPMLDLLSPGGTFIGDDPQYLDDDEEDWEEFDDEEDEDWEDDDTYSPVPEVFG